MPSLVSIRTSRTRSATATPRAMTASHTATRGRRLQDRNQPLPQNRSRRTGCIQGPQVQQRPPERSPTPELAISLDDFHQIRIGHLDLLSSAGLFWTMAARLKSATHRQGKACVWPSTAATHRSHSGIGGLTKKRINKSLLSHIWLSPQWVRIVYRLGMVGLNH